MPLQQKKTPERRCVGCGLSFPKKSLIRVVRQPEGGIMLDPVGKAAGRGAYLCRSVECFRKARKGKKFERSLSSPIPEEIYDKMEAELEQYVKA